MKRKYLAKAALLASISSVSASALAAPLLWVGDSGGTLGTVDVATGNVNVVGAMGATMTDIAFDPNGNLYGISFSNLYSINKTTGAASLIGAHNITGGSKNSLVFDAAGTLYAANNSLYTLNTGTGASTLVGNGGSPYSSSGDLAFIGGDLFLSSGGGVGGDKLVELNTATGAGTDVGNIGFSAVYGLATDNNVNLYGLTGTRVLGVNTATGAGTELVNYSGQGLGTAWGSSFFSEAGATVPEPSTLSILGLGLTGLAFASRKKSKV